MAVSVSSQRNAVSNLYCNGDTEYVNDIKRLKTKALAEAESTSDGLFDYYVDDFMKDRFSSKGVYLSVHCFRPHPHPISKMTENHFLYNVLVEYIKDKCLIISCKENKVKRVELRKTNIKVSCNKYNRLVHAKDTLRYHNPHRVLDLEGCEVLSTELSRSEQVFIHDEVHYWSLPEFQGFLGLCTGVNQVLYTIVYPPELEAGYRKSLYPEAYEFELQDGYFTWYPDGNAGGAYKQPINPWLLTTRKTVDSRGETWTICKLESIGAHHMFLAARGSLACEDEYTYDDFTIIDPYKVLKGRRWREEEYLRARFIKPVLLYLMTLKKGDAHSGLGKLRQLTHGKENMGEALFIAQLAVQLKEAKLFDKMGSFKVIEAVKQALTSALPGYCAYIVDNGEYNTSSVEQFILQCTEAKVTIKRVFRDYIPLIREKALPSPSTHDFPDWDDLYLELLRNQSVRGGGPYSQLTSERCTCVQMVVLARREMSESRPHAVELNKIVPINMKGYMGNLRYALTGVRTYSATTCKLLTYPEDPALRLDTKRMNLDDLEKPVSVMGKETRQQSDSPRSQDHRDNTVTEGIEGCCKLKPELRRLEMSDFHLNELSFTDQLRGRRARFYSRRSTGYAYKGGEHVSAGWPEIIEDFSIALGLDESYDHCLAQCYSKGGKIGMHKDDEDCYTGLQSVVTVNVNGEAKFTILCEETNKKTVYELKAGDVLIMPAGAQSNHKHSVEAISPGRVSLTFRNGIKGDNLQTVDEISEYSEDSIEFSESLDYLSANKNRLCALDVFAEHLGMAKEIFVATANAKNPRLLAEIEKGGASLSTLLKSFEAFDISGSISGDEGHLIVNGKYRPLHLSISDDHVSSMSENPVLVPSFTKAMMLSETVTEQIYEVSHDAANRLVDSFQEGYTGVLLNRFRTKISKLSLHGSTSRKVMTCFGFAGCGKSNYPQAVLNNCKLSRTLVISPRKALCEDWVKKTKRSGKHIVSTFEKALMLEPDFESVIIDEIGLLPPGYIDLVSILYPDASILLIGDPLQCEYYNPSDQMRLAESTQSAFKNLRGTSRYMLFSHRLPSTQNIMEVNALGALGEKPFLRMDEKAKDQNVLCASREAKERIDGAHTVGECQGLSFDTCVLELDDDWLKMSDEAVMVAFSRCRKQVKVKGTRPVLSRLVERARSGFLRTILSGKRITEAAILELLESKLGDVVLLRSEKRLADTDGYEEKLNSDPYLMGLLHLLEEPEVEEEELPEPQVPEPVTTHLCISALDNDLAPTMIKGQNIKSKEEREVHCVMGTTEQIDEVGNKESPHPATHKALYLSHKNDDAVTFMLSVKKRLSFRDPEKNRRSYNKVRDGQFGKQMLKVLTDTYGLVSPSSLEDISISEARFAEKRLQKSKALIEKHAYRSDPDWPSNFLKVFLKQQVCTKMEKRGVDAKAGQTIACFAHSVLCRFGAQLRRTEKTLRSMLPENVLIFSQKNYTDLDNWVKVFVTTQEGTDSDYEAFDKSQDEKILDFEVELLKFMCWPQELIEEYTELKLMMGCELGNLAIMRFSGEFGTFFFNTVCNMAFTCMRYNITDRTAVCFAGDDMYAPGTLSLKKTYEKQLDSLNLKAKVNYSNEPLFCGWRISPYGIVKDPNLLLDRWKIAELNGTIKDCMVNYAIEACFGYRLGELLYELNIDLDAHQELVRKIVLRKDEFPPGVAKLFSDDPEECGSDGEELSFRIAPEGGLG